jgi:basic amino acid/polyamine antiporter, APA family
VSRLTERIFARKSFEQLQREVESGDRLHRALGPVQLSGLGIGAIIGAGIFVMTGRVAAVDAGPAVMLSYVVAAFACLCAALCYAEFASTAPVAGSAYTYAYASFGQLAAWIIGWDLILEYGMSCAVVAAAWSEYINELLYIVFGFRIPASLCNDPFTPITDADGNPARAYFNLPAVLIMVGVTALLVRGIRESALANGVFVVIKTVIVLFVIFVGAHYVNRDYWTKIPVEQRIGAIPASTSNASASVDGAASVTDEEREAAAKKKWGLLGSIGVHRWFGSLDETSRSPFMPYGMSGMMLGAALVFFAFIGFDAVSTHAEEAKNPQRDIPIGVLASLVVCAVLYIGVSAVITGMVPYPQIDQKAAVAAAFRQRGELLPEGTERSLLNASAALIALGALAGMTSVLLITFQSQTRIFLAMARDGLLPKSIFAAIHKTFRTPYLCTLLVGGLVSLIAAFTPILMLEEMVNIGTLFAFALVCGSVLMMRIRDPHTRRPFRVPMVWFFAPAGLFFNVLLMLFLPIDTWIRLVVWLAIGLVIYFAYGLTRNAARATAL